MANRCSERSEDATLRSRIRTSKKFCNHAKHDWHKQKVAVNKKALKVIKGL